LCLVTSLLAGAASAQNLDSFRIIGQRNIFNLNRTPQLKTTYARPTYRSTGGESLTLVGTMAYETNQLAFFDGTSPDCRKALKLDDTIAGYKLVSISFNRVRLEANGQPVELYVGARLPRATGSAAPPSTNVEYNVSAPVATDAPAAPTASAAPAAPWGPAADPSDILKKLMQKREQEMK
jgi:hypothetical protein